MRYLLPILLAISTSLEAQTSAWEQILAKESTHLETQLAAQRSRVQKNEKDFNEASLTLQQSEALIERLRPMQEKRQEIKARLNEEIKAIHDQMPMQEKLFSRKAKLYRCFQDFLKTHGHVYYSECTRLNSVPLSPAEEKQLKQWDHDLGLSDKEAQLRLAEAERDIKRSRSTIKHLEKNLPYDKERLKSLEKGLKKNQELKKEVKLVQHNPASLKCNSSAPVINLEQDQPFPGAKFKGAFHGIPRDNQDGLGTCYANTARNLLVGMSGGEADPSFLDIALVYKKSTKGIGKDGLDSGVSCSALEMIKEEGYCPQGFAPLEGGEQNHAFESLFGKKQDSLWVQSKTIELLKDFVQGKEEISKNKGLLQEELLQKAHWMISKMKENPHIKIPLPVAKVDIPPLHALRYSHYERKDSIGVTEAKFIEEYREAYKKFYPTYLKSLVGNKTREEIFDLFKQEMAPFIEKYQLKGELAEWLRSYIIETRQEYESPNYQKSLKDSMAFLKSMTGKEGMKDEEVLSYCISEMGPGLDFLGKLQPLVSKLQENGANPDLLFDKNGKFRSGEELMQLAVAPACIHPENRKKLPFDFHCDDGYGTIGAIKKSGKTVDEQKEMLRERVLMSLMSGYPVGNTFQSGPSTWHINTIVGMRFNPENKSCEYLIRESQTGRSEWESESKIYQKIEALTEVRKQ